MWAERRVLRSLRTRLFRRWKRKERLPAQQRRPRFDTGYLRTYTVFMNVTLSIDEQTVERARKRAQALGKSLNQLIRDYLQKLAGGDDSERSIEEFERLSGGGHSNGWKFDRD